MAAGKVRKCRLRLSAVNGENCFAQSAAGQLEARAFRPSFVFRRAREGDESLNRVHELYTASRLDQPSLGRVTARPLEDWRREVFDELKGLPDAYFVASDRERLVGCSAVHAAGEDVLRILITGVLPEYRRRGIARLLKLRVHAWARANGYREIHTSTANPAVVALNTALGYAIVASWGGYELAIR